MMNINLSNVAYDKLRIIVQIWLPAISAFYAAMAVLWGFGYVEQVVGTIAAITVLAGSVLGISRKNFNADVALEHERVLEGDIFDGALVVDENDPLKDTFVLKLDVPFDELKTKDSIALRVENVEPSQ